MDPPELVQAFVDLESSVHCKASWNDFECLGVLVEDQMLLSTHSFAVHSQELAEFHLDGSSPRNNPFSLDDPSYNHNGVIQTPLCLLNELLCPSPENYSRGLALGTLLEQIESLGPKNLLLEHSTSPQHLRLEVGDGGLDFPPGGLHGPFHILLRDPARAKDISVREVLSGEVSDGELREDDIGPAFNDLVQFVVNNFPLRVHDLLELVWVLDSNFRVVFFRLKLEFDVQEDDLGVEELFGLLLEPCITKGPFEGHPVNQPAFLYAAPQDLFDSDEVFVEKVPVQFLHRLHDHFSEKLFVVGQELAVQTGLGASQEHESSLVTSLLEGDGHVLEFLQ